MIIANGSGIDASSITSGTIDAARMYVAIDTYANIVANHAGAAEGAQAWAVDLDIAVRKNASGLWRPVGNVLECPLANNGMYTLIGGSGATWSRDANGLITVTLVAHGLLTDFNGATCHLTQGTLLTGSTNITTGWGFTSFTYVDANTFTVQSDVLEAATGALGSNTSETYFPTIYTAPAGLLQDNDTIAASNAGYARFKSNANNKTYRDYFGGVQIISANVTTQSVWQVHGSVGVIMQSPTTAIFQNVAGIQTLADLSHKRSVQLANAGDWYVYRSQRLQYQFHS